MKATTNEAEEPALEQENTLLAGQKRVLEMIANDAPLDDTLTALVEFIEAREDGLRCTILVADDDGQRFTRSIGPNVPRTFHDTLGDVPIGPPYLGSCGEATHLDKPIIVSNMATEQRYAPEWRKLMLQCGLAATHSLPVHAADGRVLASFALHRGSPAPAPAHPELLEIATRLAGIALERQASEEHRKHRERALMRHKRRLQTLNRIARLVASDLDVDRIVQSVADAATDITEAQFGAFFYTDIARNGTGTRKFAVSGAPRELFEKFGVPRDASLFGHTFRDGVAIRRDDIRDDPRYGTNAPYQGVPNGHPPVVSYLAVPVLLRSGETLGALVFGHGQPGIFTEETQELVTGIAAHTATAIDNARLFEAARHEIERSRRAERATQQLAAIVESSDDAMIRKDLDGIIQTWNRGAERLFGYSAEEAVGQSVTILFPPGHEDEEPRILACIRRGESIHHYDAVRRHKDGSRVDISLTISPIKDATGTIVGASKIAHDISDRRAAEAHRDLLLREVNHRARNMLHTVQSIALQTRHKAASPEAFEKAFLARLTALSHTHDLLTRSHWRGAGLRDLAKAELAPYRGNGRAHWTLEGIAVELDSKTALALGMTFHELATNAGKYGALSTTEGRVQVSWCLNPGTDADTMLHIEWSERDGPPVGKPTRGGFGSRLITDGLAHELDADVRLDFKPEGLRCVIDLPLRGPGTGDRKSLEFPVGEL
jgi:PAS domain S-box-containing protein